MVIPVDVELVWVFNKLLWLSCERLCSLYMSGSGGKASKGERGFGPHRFVPFLTLTLVLNTFP